MVPSRRGFEPGGRAKLTSVSPDECAAAAPARRPALTSGRGPVPAGEATGHRRSWHPHHQRSAQQKLETQGCQPQQNQGTGCLVVPGIAGHLDGSLLQRIDLAENPAESLTVLGAKISAASLLGDLLEQWLVDSHRQELVAKATQTSTGRDWGFADRPYPDGIDLDAEGSCGGG